MKARENPFRVECLHALRFRFLTGSMEELLSRLQAQNLRGTILGPHGSGKTTLLEELSTQLRRQGHQVFSVRFTDANANSRRERISHCVNEVPQGTILLLDGAEQLSRLERRLIQERSTSLSGLILTSHRPEWLPVLYICRTSEALLNELVSELTQQHLHLTPQFERALLHNHRGNLRECLRELYDRFSNASHLR